VTYASGNLLYMRQGILVAQPFDPAGLVTQGEAVPLAADARMDERYSRDSFTVSANGVLAYQTGKLLRWEVLRRFDRAGRVVATLGEPVGYYGAGNCRGAMGIAGGCGVRKPGSFCLFLGAAEAL
jgi:hypothetical protein